jgi:hypothetical protein
MGNNQNMWSHRTKIIFHEINIIFHPLRSLAGFPARVIVLWQENVGGTRNASLASDCYNVVVDVVFKCQTTFQWTWNMFASSILHVCVFLVSFGIIKHLWHAGSGNMKIYLPTSIIFPSGVALREYDTLGWINFLFPSTACNKCILLYLIYYLP